MDFSTFVLSILTAIIGLLMIFVTDGIIKFLVIALGVYLILFGAFLMFNTSKVLTDRNFKIAVYTRGTVSIILGLLCIILPATIAEFAWKVMIYILASYAIISAAAAGYDTIKMHEAGLEVKKNLAEIAISLLAAVILFLLPSNFGSMLIKFAGGCLIVAAIVMAFIAWKNRPIIDEDAEVTDED